jgi:hypothetical protein
MRPVDETNKMAGQDAQPSYCLGCELSHGLEHGVGELAGPCRAAYIAG